MLLVWKGLSALCQEAASTIHVALGSWLSKDPSLMPPSPKPVIRVRIHLPSCSASLHPHTPTPTPKRTKLICCLWGSKTRCDVICFQAERGLREALGETVFLKEGNQIWIIRAMGNSKATFTAVIGDCRKIIASCLMATAMRTVHLLCTFHWFSDAHDCHCNYKQAIDSILILIVTVARSWAFLLSSPALTFKNF